MSDMTPTPRRLSEQRLAEIRKEFTLWKPHIRTSMGTACEDAMSHIAALEAEIEMLKAAYEITKEETSEVITALRTRLDAVEDAAEEAGIYLNLMLRRGSDMLNQAIPHKLAESHLVRTIKSGWKRYDALASLLAQEKRSI